MDHYYALIMAGGGGTRLWPMSRGSTPKQMLPLVEEESMFSVSVNRLAPLFRPEQIYIVAGEKHVDALRKQAPEVPAQNFIAEPSARDSGPAAALGISVIQQRDPQATIVLLTADHHIADKDGFRRVLATAHDVAQQNTIVTLGISASLPSTGFGYIQRGELLSEVNGFRCYKAVRFTEKPNFETAVAFIASGDYSWNSGMFAMRADTAMAEFQRQQPEIYRLMRQLQPMVDTPEYQNTLHDIWQQVPKISIDYAIMEDARNMAVIPVDIGWSDVGSWDALYDVLQPDDCGNCFKGNAPDRITVDTKNTLVYSDKLTVTIGVENLVIVETDDVLMVCRKERAQDVREVVSLLREKNNEHYL